MRILVVEDDRLLNNTLCYNLDTAGYVVDSALTKSAASNFLTKQDYDLIVLDVNLPDGNGFDFCREVKERRPDTAVIFLTANDMERNWLKWGSRKSQWDTMRLLRVSRDSASGRIISLTVIFQKLY